MDAIRFISTFVVYSITLLIVALYGYVVFTKGVHWRSRTSAEVLPEEVPVAKEPPPGPAAPELHRNVLTVIPSSTAVKLEPWRSDKYDLVFINYGSAESNCSFCVYTHAAIGVKWQLWESLTDSEWFLENKDKYEWLWYPDDDLIFNPGDLDLFLKIATSSRFSVLQPSLCPGSEIHHPTLKQRPDIWVPIVPMYTVELQMPFGRRSWWDSIKEPYLRHQVFGFGVDLVWTKPVGYELSTGVVNAVCATHPYRKDLKHHVSGLGEAGAGALGLTGDSLWDEYRANKMRFRISFTAGRPEDDYWWHYRWDVRWAQKGSADCREACGKRQGVGGTPTDSCIYTDAARANATRGKGKGKESDEELGLGYHFLPEVYPGCGEESGMSDAPGAGAACCACLVMDRSWPAHKSGKSLHHGR